MEEKKNGVPIRTCRWSSNREEERFVVDNPATGEPVAMVQGGGVAEVDGAVHAAHKAFNANWRFLPARERAGFMIAGARLLRENIRDLAALECQENGKPLIQAFYDVDACIGSFEYFGGLIANLPGIFLDFGPVYAPVFLEPHGVVAGILPFNWPPIHTGAKAAPALAVGNTVVLKPGEQAPLTVMRIVELLQTIFPPNVIDVVPGYGPVTGQALVSHPLVRKVSFTGASTTGVSVLKLAADHLTPTTLELGGKNALIVFDDADLDLAVAGAFEGAFYNQGEACTAASRILVHQSLYDAFVARLAERVKAIRVGDGADPQTQVGPLVSQLHQQRVLNYIELGRKEGATITAQASIPADPRLKNGFFVAPTLFTDVRHGMRIAQEEIFGPVACVIPFDTEDEAVVISNGTDYGLVGAVYTRNHELAMRMSRRLDVGIVFVNNYFRGWIGMPFGGTKATGFGREHSIETLREYGWSKTVRIPSGIGDIPQWGKGF